jgi:Tfp pilus assembly protein FimV
VRADRPAETPHLRLTRRGRSVLVTSAVLAASLIWFAAATAAQASDHGTKPGPAGHSMSQIVVQPGQTLWSIAAQADPSADTRLVIQQIVAANSLTTENIAAGQHLWVPAK